MARQYRFLRFEAGVDWKHVDPNLLSRLNHLGMLRRQIIDVTSGARSYAKQQYLYQHAKELGLVQGKTVARPGHSMHNYGPGTGRTRAEAVDAEIGGKPIAQVVPAAQMRKAGLVNPVPGDPVHTQLAGSGTAAPAASAPQAVPAQAAPAGPQAPIPDVTIGVAPPAPMPGVATGPPLLAPGSVNAEDFAPRQIAELWNLVAQQPNPSPDTLGYAQLAQQAAGGR